MSDEMTDTQKLKSVPKLREDMNKLLRLIIGDADMNQPGLLEEIRNIANDVKEIKKEQHESAKLEERVRALEERHRAIDAQKKKTDPYRIAMFTITLSNLAAIIMWIFGFGR